MFRFFGMGFLGLILLTNCSINKDAIERRIAADKQKMKSATVKPLPKISQNMARRTVNKPQQPYILGVEDVIKISVFNDATLNSQQSIRPDGKISFFPTGDMQAAGLTLETLRKQIVKRLKNVASKPYVLGVGDILTISVYNHKELTTSQAIRPDGKISIIPGGEIMARGRTVGSLAAAVQSRVSTIIKNPFVNVVVAEYKSKPIIISDPIVNVVVMEYNSKKVSILGEVVTPGILRLKSNTSLVEGISHMGGLTKTADLKRAMIFRNQKILPINFKKLFKQGDISQNISLKANDTVFIPSSTENKVYVVGEIKQPGTVVWEGDLRLLEAVALAGGYTKDSKEQTVLVIKGSLADPTLMLVDAQSITKEGKLENNIQLESGDMIYVPKTEIANVERYLDFVIRVFSTAVLAETGYLLGKDIVEGRRSTVGVNVTP